MKQLTKYLATAALTLSASLAWASPAYMVTHNKTNVESNAFIDGKASPAPTAANSDGRVHWAVVRMACFGHTRGGLCPAVIKMATNTPNPVTIGTLNLNVETGEISPGSLSGGGYTVTVNGRGEATLTKD